MGNAKKIQRLLEGVFIFILGILLLWKQTDFLQWATFLISLIVITGGAAQLISCFRKKEKKAFAFLFSFIYIALGLSMLILPQIPFYALPILFAGYLLMNGLIKMIDSVLIIKNKAEDLFYSLLPSLFYISFGILLLFSPLYHIRDVLIIIGIYCVLLSLTYLMDFIRMLLPARANRKIFRKIRISLPVFLAAFIPHTVLTKLNQFLAGGKERKAEDFQTLQDNKSKRPPDLEIYIHVASDGFCAIGHADICFEGELIAYGNYDEASSNPLGFGDGVLIITNKKQYIPFCLKFNKTTIFSFGLRLEEEQRKRIRERIQEIKSQLYEWLPPYPAALRQNSSVNPADFPDFSSGLFQAAKARFFKFTSGKFKTYFVLSTNCVLLADSIVCRAGTDILNVNGIISPGTFYEYLEAEFLKKDSMVITRKVYTLDNLPDWE